MNEDLVYLNRKSNHERDFDEPSTYKSSNNEQRFEELEDFRVINHNNLMLGLRNMSVFAENKENIEVVIFYRLYM